MTSIPDRHRRAYERARVRRAALGAAPGLAYPIVGVTLGGGSTAAALGIVACVLAGLGLYAGRPFARGVGLGWLLGAIPFSAAAFAQRAGHLCLDGSCMAVCVPACTTAGVATGLLGSYLVVRLRGGLGSLGMMSVLVTLAGAMGCRCVGLGSVLGIVLGLLVASTPAMPRIVTDTFPARA